MDQHSLNEYDHTSRRFPKLTKIDEGSLLDNIQIINYNTSNITKYKINDRSDRFLLAAAVYCNAKILISNDKKAFRKHTLRSLNITLFTPEDFIANHKIC
jgi:predicted nucleic acid-binding protein